MPTKTISPQALQIINDYSHLPIDGHDISVPYFNNQRSKVRAGLRALIGKGSVEDIIEEAKIISLRDKINLEKISDESLKKFLVDNNIGIDCSALVYYTINAEFSSQNKKPLQKLIKFSFAKNPFRKLLAKLRPVENAGVNTLIHEDNSHEVELKNVQPGDMIIMIATGIQHNLNHVLLVHQVDYNEQNIPVKISYSHSFKWTSDGKYGTGIKQGTIEINDPGINLMDQKWTENSKIGEENETFIHAKMARELMIKRLKLL